MKNKSIFLDIDGTLLNDEGILSQENIDAAIALKNDGWAIHLVTGNSFTVANKINKKLLNEENSLVAWSGSYIKNKDKTLFKKPLNNDVVSKLIKKYKDKYTIAIQTTNHTYANNDEHIKNIFPIINDISKFSDEDAYLMLIVFNANDKNEFNNVAQETCGFNRQIWGFNNNRIIAILPGSIDKGFALNFLRVANSYDICVASGDGTNDVQMFNESNYSIAVANSMDILKTNADYILNSTNNDNALVEIKDVINKKFKS